MRYADHPLVTTTLVRGETWTFIRDRVGHRAAVDLLDAIGASPRVDLAPVSEEIEDGAVKWLRRHDERVYSFVDATSFALMRARRITQALAFDEDFAAAGFVAVKE